MNTLFVLYCSFMFVLIFICFIGCNSYFKKIIKECEGLKCRVNDFYSKISCAIYCINKSITNLEKKVEK